jgi:hypothetical protein
MKKTIVIRPRWILLLVIIGLIIWLLLGRSNRPAPVNNQVPSEPTVVTSTEMIVVDSPSAGAIITSPVTISGQARGQWYFEASFPVKVVDANGQELASVPAQAQADWMTEDFVPFQAVIDFNQPSTSSGFLILFKDNPSGLPQNDAQIKIPVKFDLSLVVATSTPQRAVKLYYYNASRDQDEQGNIQCSRQGLVAVNREIPISQSPIKDTINLFLQSALTATDTAAGLTSEFPLAGVSLESLVLKDGVLTIRLADLENKTGGGSCRVAILWAQLEATALQFSEVKSVKFEPEELFQP